MNNKWTMKDVLKARTSWVIILTVFLTYYIYKAIYRIFEELAFTMQNENLGYILFEIAVYAGFIVAPVLAFFLSVLLNKGFLVIKGVTAPKSQTEEEIYRAQRESQHERAFKWRNSYGVLAGYIVLFIGAGLSSSLWDSDQISTSSDLAIRIIPVMIIIIIAAVFTAKKLNKYMIAKTQTNKIVLEDIRAGLYKSELPEDKEKMVIHILEKGMVTSVKEGLRYIKFRDAGRVAGIILAIVTLGGCYLISKEMDKATNNFVQGIRNDNAQYWRNKEAASAINAAYANARQAQRDADFHRRQADKARNYNPKSYDAYRKSDIADNAQRAADEALKNARRM